VSETKNTLIPASERPARLRGVLSVYWSHKWGWVARRWQPPRSGPLSDNQQTAVDQFKFATQAVKQVPPEVVAVMRELTRNATWTWKDLAISSMYGKGWEVQTSDGQIIVGWRQMNEDINAWLDSITTTTGAILVRGPTGWGALTPGSAGTVLTSKGETAIPDYIAIPGGGGGGGSGGAWWRDHVPAAGLFSLQNATGTDLVVTDDSDVGLLIDCGPPVSGDKIAMAYQTLSDPSLAWVLTARLQTVVTAENYATVGLIIRDSISGRCMVFGTGPSYDYRVFQMNGLSGYHGINYNQTAHQWAHWWQIENDGTNITYRVSAEGKLWIDLFSASKTDWLSNAPDQVGFGVEYNRTAHKVAMCVNYYDLSGTAV
jgi:hypothetical protein